MLYSTLKLLSNNNQSAAFFQSIMMKANSKTKIPGTLNVLVDKYFRTSPSAPTPKTPVRNTSTLSQSTPTLSKSTPDSTKDAKTNQPRRTINVSVDGYFRTTAATPIQPTSTNEKKVQEMPAPPWKEAASIIIAARTSLNEIVGSQMSNLMGATFSKNLKRCDYRLLMVKRSSLSSFMANAYVFPGGLVELADFSPRWYEVFDKLGVTRDSLDNFCTSVTGPRPTMITNPSTLAGADRKGQNFLPPDIALRIAAIRETFEETGILLLTKPPKEGNKISSDLLFSMKGENSNLNLVEWRDRIHEDPLNFIDLCLETKTCPNLWSLYEWWDWLTPTSVGHRRYDTMFYLCCLDKQPEVVLDQSEVITLKWCSPSSMLEEHSANSVFLAPPQVYELSRLHHLSSYVQLQQFAQKRGIEGVEQWLPVIATAQDGALSLLPGDDMYPTKPDYFGRSPGPDYPYTLSELQARVRSVHRMAVQGPICTAYCNITPGCGHLQPLTYRSSEPAVQSYL